MTNYRDLTEQGAAAAFEEFMAERGPALDRLRDRMAADGVYPSELLDGSVGSLVPLWRWVLTHLTKRDDPGATDPAMVPREQWPSWERYTWEEEPVLSLESLLLLDGVVSCLAAVVTDRAPTARWEVAHHKVKRYEFNNHPVLVGDGGIHNFLPALPLVEARATLLGVRQSPDDRISTTPKVSSNSSVPSWNPWAAQRPSLNRSSRSRTSGPNRVVTTSRSDWVRSSPTNDPTTSTGCCANSPRRMGCPG